MPRMTDSGHAAARSLLLAHVHRALIGSIEDPAVFAAVVGVERLVVATKSTDAETLRAAVEGRPAGHADAATVAALAGEVERHVLAGLDRRAAGLTVDAGLVNPDAGNYEVTTDATLLRAAVRAAQRSFDAMPYYRVRYGERGSRFASTDSAWLISLAALGKERAIRQVAWLSRVLAGRGMPSWLLETHLDELVAEVRSVADEDAVGALPAAAASLASVRRRHVDDHLLALADTWAEEALGAGIPVPRTGALVAAATSDELTGAARDDRALMDWLTDPGRLAADAADALRDVRRRVREHAR
jgi:hypothetical protein